MLPISSRILNDCQIYIWEFPTAAIVNLPAPLLD